MGSGQRLPQYKLRPFKQFEQRNVTTSSLGAKPLRKHMANCAMPPIPGARAKRTPLSVRLTCASGELPGFSSGLEKVPGVSLGDTKQ